MRVLVPLLFVAALASAGDLERIIGEETWRELPEWRRKMIAQRYEQYRQMPEEHQHRVRKKGLREFLIRPTDRLGKESLPKSLRRDLERLPPQVRPLAGKLLVMRLRQVRLDRNLALLPFEERRPLFNRLFPIRFDPTEVRRAHKEFSKRVAQAIAARVEPTLAKEERVRGSPYTEDERIARARELIHAFTRREEERAIQRVGREVLRLRSGKPEQIRRVLEREGYHVLERIQILATPRQRELIRYAVQPEGCPLIDLGWMGKRPDDRAERVVWEHDFRVLARIDLLTEAGFPPELVLHLAAAASAEDFLRAVKALRGYRSKSSGPEGR